MKMLLIYANGVSEGYLPVGLASLAGAIRRAGHEASIFDTSFYANDRNTDRQIREKFLEFKKIDQKILEDAGLTKSRQDMGEDLRAKIAEFSPDLIGVGATSTEFPYILPYLYEVRKNFDIPIVVGGVHPTLVPEKVLRHPCIDMVCIGEGEEAIVELLSRMDAGKDITDTPNFWIKRGGKIHRNDVRPLTEDLDVLPYPAWDLFDKRHFIRPFEGRVKYHGFFEFTRGCPYSCHYCINPFLQEKYKGKGRYHRQKSARRMIDEIIEFNRYIECDHIQFVDDMFLALGSAKLEEFSRLYRNNLRATTVIMARPESITPEKAAILKDVNCAMVLMGLESGNERIRKELCNRHMDEAVLSRARDLLKANRIKISTYNMIGFPDETRENVFETIELNRRLRPDRMTVKILCPFEGTRIRQICIEKKYIDEDDDISKMFYEDTCLKMPQLSEEAIRGLRKTFILYASMPRWLWPLVRICEKENMLANFLYYNLFARLNYIGKN